MLARILRSSLISLLTTLLGCSPHALPPISILPPGRPAPEGYVPVTPFCRDSIQTGLWSADCQVYCLPRHQVDVACSASLGLVAVSDIADLKYATTLESSSLCGAPSWRVWELDTLKPPALSDINLGGTGLTTGSDCSLADPPDSSFCAHNPELEFYRMPYEVSPPSD